MTIQHWGSTTVCISVNNQNVLALKNVVKAEPLLCFNMKLKSLCNTFVCFKPPVLCLWTEKSQFGYFNSIAFLFIRVNWFTYRT